MRRRAGPSLPLLAALLAAAAVCAAAVPQVSPVMAIDLGAEFLKLSIVKPGRIPISVVINEMSKRKTPALVAFVDGDRLVGEEAAAVAARFPDRVYGRLLDLLGRPADNPQLTAMLKASYRPYALERAPNRTSPAAAAVRTGDELRSAEELVASLLEYAKGLAEAAADGAAVTDAVLTVPASFTIQQRQALLDAAKLAGLNVLGLIHSHAAAALQYGIERDFTNRTDHVILYDLGAASLQAALVTYSAYTGAKGASISQFDVRDVVWRENLGGEHLELVLMEHFADEFNKQLGGGQDVRTVPRAMAKLRKQVARTKQILSANTEAPISVEELWQDRDFRSTISRQKFEELAGDFWARAVEPVTTLLARNNLTSADLAGVQLLGGTSRVPRIKAALSEALGGRALDMHLDADEATVLGAGLFGANLSSIFRLRQFGMADKTPYSVAIQMDHEQGPKTLVPALKKMPTKRGVHLHNLTDDSLAFTLAFDNAPGAMPECHHAFPLGSFNVSGIHSVIDKYNSSGKVSIHTRVDQSGVFAVVKADATVEVWEELPPPPPPPAANTSDNATGADGEAKAEEAGKKEEDSKDSKAGKKEAAAAPALAPEEAPKLRKRVVKVPLNVTGGLFAPGMNDTEMTAARRVMRRLRAHDQAKRETAKARNDLEAYIIATRDLLDSSEEWRAATTEEQRDAFSAQLTDTEDWLYGDGEAVDVTEYRSKLRKLKETGDAIAMRVVEAKQRPQLVKLARDFVELARKAVNTWPEAKPWLDADDIAHLVEKVDNFTAWLDDGEAQQAKRAAHEDPAFKSEEVSSWLMRLQKEFTRLNSKKKPRPPPPPPPPVDANATDAEGAKAGGDGAEGEQQSEGEQQGQGDGKQQEQQEKQEEQPAAEEDEDKLDHDELR